MQLCYSLIVITASVIIGNAEINIPPEFLIGTASSAFQIEGAWNVSDKGVSVWDYYTHTKPWLVDDKSNADVACDSYHKYKEDVQLLKTIGVNYYKFSLSWARILPMGYTNVISKDGIAYYNNLIDELLLNEIEPFVTLYHWDHPEIIEKLGGWTNELFVDLFVDYARVVFREFGSKVKFFLTINEPSIYCPHSYSDTEKAPGDYGKYLCGHNILKAHARVYHMYDTEFRAQQKGQISIPLICANYYSLNNDDTLSENIAFQYDCGWFAHPIFSQEGDYPMVMKDRIEENSKVQGYSTSRLPTFDENWIQIIRGSADFFALNHYTSNVAYPVNGTNLPWYNDIGLNITKDPSWQTAASPWLNVVPQGLGKLLRIIKEEYNNPPVYIMENGYSDANETLHDDNRIHFLYSYMKEMFNAINDGCNVKSYTVWSFIDNFEWLRGYTERFGLVHVNFTDPNKQRTLKDAAHWLTQVIQSRKLVPVLESN